MPGGEELQSVQWGGITERPEGGITGVPGGEVSEGKIEEERNTKNNRRMRKTLGGGAGYGSVRSWRHGMMRRRVRRRKY